jgi:hypothetical protein
MIERREARGRQRQDDAIDQWAGRAMNVLAGVGLVACLALLSVMAGYIWGLLY